MIDTPPNPSRMWIVDQRLKAALTQTVSVMEKWSEMNVSTETKRKLDRISAATIDRLLRPERKRLELKSRSEVI